MQIKYWTISVIMLFTAVCFAQSPTCAKKITGEQKNVVTPQVSKEIEQKPEEKSQPAVSELDKILKELGKKTRSLSSYQAQVEYLLIQAPGILDATTLQTGHIYYAKTKDESDLRLSFLKRKIDDGKAEDYIQEFLFDGVWLTRVDYQNKQVDQSQQVPEDKPIGVFEFIGKHFPLIGFADTDELGKDFEITLLEKAKDDPNNVVHLKLEVKKDSKYKDDYVQIDFWLDKTSYLPARLLTVSTEEDIYDFRFIDAKINKKIENSVFNLEWPADFGQNRVPLKQTE